MAADAAGEGVSGRLPEYAGHPRLGLIIWFRTIAILLIVAGHSYGLSGIHLGAGFDNALSDLVKGATALFVFISGFVFDYVFSARYSYWSFILDRVKKLAIPYCLLTILAGFMFSNWAGGGLSSDQIFRYFVFGDAFQAYWYIPFILLMFALAPLHRLFMDLKTSHQFTIIVVGAILGGVVQRPIGNDNAFQSVVFYLPVYLSGLFLSLHRETLLPALRKKWPRLLLAAVLLAVIQSAGGQSDNMQKPFFAIHGFELMGFQKLALSFGLVGLFATLSSPPGRIVSIIADTSFAIFFLHPFVLNLLGGTTLFQLTHLPWINLAIATTAIVALCALIALALRALLKANSKYIIGY
ncbi:acyltransferase [Aquibium sp. ELW1220]|uniref:acyltransferase family protein n=1 Tax=Aquibium sp. ELW1220 TaxID=2976766 RepID=UPI0025B02968|nr:acyltransferase [Aquibium sp. ELW1220]MDN2578903.1 acyltransferase [Aquibium sp. ELW1220]